MEQSLNASVRKMSIANLIVWLAVLVSGGLSIYFFRMFDLQGDMMDQAKSLLVLKNVSFLVSLVASILGVVYATNFRKVLRTANVSGGGLLLISMWFMLGSTLLSLQSIPGINIYFGTLNTLVDDSLKDFSGLAITGIFSLVAILIFTAAVVLNYVGILQITSGEKDRSNALTGLSGVKLSSLLLMIAVVVWSPILFSYFISNQVKYENVTACYIITAIVYLAAVGYYLLSWSKVKTVSVIPASEITAKTYVPIDPTLKKLLTQFGKWQLYTWAMVLASFILLSFFFIGDSKILAFLTLIPYIIGWYMIVQGFRMSCRLEAELKRRNVSYGNIFRISYIALGIISFLSFNTLVGGNVTSWHIFSWEEIKEVLSEWSDIYSLIDFVEFTSLISLFLFILFPVLLLIGTAKLSSIIPGLKRSIIGAGILVLASIIFAPLFCLFAIDEGDDPFLYLLLSWIAYAAGIYYYTRSWNKCDTIDQDFASVPEAPSTPEKPIGNNDNLCDVKGLLSDKPGMAMAIAGVIAIVISCITIFSFFGGSGSNKTSTTPAIPGIELDEAMKRVNDAISNRDEPEVYTIEEGAVHPDGYYREDEEQQEVTDLLNKFYSAVIPKVNNMQNYDNLIKANFTPEFYSLYRAVENVEDGDIGFFDFDFVSMSQDPDLSKAVVDDVEIESDSNDQLSANVSVSLKGRNGSSTPISIRMVKTPQGWKIKDYNDYFNDMKSYKESM